MYPIKVLMIVPNLRVSNGVASFAMNYYREINHNKIKMDFLAYEKIKSPYIDEIETNGDRVIYISSIKNIFKHLKECKKILIDGQYDVIHNNSLLITLPMMITSVNKVKHKILHSHSTALGENMIREIRNRIFLPILISTSNKYVACSLAAGKNMFRKRDFAIINNVIDPNVFKFNPKIRCEIKKWENCEGKYIIVTVGRITYAKNPFFAVDVIEQLLSRCKDVEYWWIGSGELDSDMKKYIESKKLQDKIKLFGSRNDVYQFYQGADLFFLPSKFEGFGLACIEAETSGLQCLVSDAFPLEINITKNVNYMSLKKSAIEWSKTIEGLMCKKNDRISAFSRFKESKFSNANAGERLLNFYENL